MIFGLSVPGEGERGGALSIGDPLTLVGRIGLLRQEPAGDLDVNAVAQELDRGAGDARVGGRKSDALASGAGGDGQSDLEYEDGASGIRKNGGQLAAVSAVGIGDEGNEFVVEVGFADE